MPRIVSFLPAATEIVCALGAGDELVGRSHECDYPPEVQRLPVVSRPALPIDTMSQSDIDAAVSSQLASGESLYRVDEVLLRELAPDVVLTQDLCQVCAPSGTELSRALRELPSRPEVLWLTPRTIADVEQNVRDIACVTGHEREGDALIERGRARIDAVRQAVEGAEPRRVVFLEWTDPVFCGGHWVPEMVTLAGGFDPLGQRGGDSRRMSWKDVVTAQPGILIVGPCGYGLSASLDAARSLPEVPGMSVFAVDANAYFARPGPRLAEGIELLAHLFHPERFVWPDATQPWAVVREEASIGSRM
ncbi:MAG: cobalamin-binding protein [Gemmatimonadaceae bacterium]